MSETEYPNRPEDGGARDDDAAEPITDPETGERDLERVDEPDETEPLDPERDLAGGAGAQRLEHEGEPDADRD